MKKIFIIAVTFLLSLCLITNVNVRGAVKNAYNVITTPGEDMATEVTISYHSDVDNSFVKYTLKSDTEFKNATAVIPTSEFWGADANYTAANGRVGSTSGIYERYVCKASITGLTPDTEYIYQIFVGNEDSATSYTRSYNFKTAKGEGDFTFVHMTDPQFYSQAGADVFNDLMGLTYARKPVAFTMISGDISDKGGMNSFWEMFFNEPNLDYSVVATVPGNHEYYDAQNSVTLDAGLYNGYIKNVDNGSENSKNSSYFFKYNNALFVMIDSENQAQGNDQTEWFCDVVENNPAQYIIVSMHRSFYGSIYKSDSTTIRAIWQKYFDKYGVDLVLTGHDHVYSRSYSVYDGEITDDQYRGTTYITGGCAGEKMTYALDPSPFYAAGVDLSKTGLSTCSFVDVTEDGLIVTAINKNGETIDSCTILPKRSANSGSSSTLTKEEMIESVKFTVDEENPLRGSVSWDNKAYGLVSSVKVSNDLKVTYKDMYLYTDQYNTIDVTFMENKEYTLYVLITFKDKSQETVEITYSTKLPWGSIDNIRLENFNADEFTIDLLWDVESLNNQLSFYRIYVGDVPSVRVAANKSTYTIESFIGEEECEIILEAYNKYFNLVYTGKITYYPEIEYEIVLSKNEVTLEEGKEETIIASITPDTTESVVWASSDETVASVENGVIAAKKAGTATITASFDGKEKTITVTVTAKVIESETGPEDPVAPIEESKGCNAGNINYLLMTFGLLAVTVFRRRKNY